MNREINVKIKKISNGYIYSDDSLISTEKYYMGIDELMKKIKNKINGLI